MRLKLISLKLGLGASMILNVLYLGEWEVNKKLLMQLFAL